MAYLGAQPNKTLTKTTSQSFNGTGSATVFTLNRAVNTEEELEVFVENVQQEPGSGKSYTASGTTLTFDEAPPSGTGNVYVIYRGLAEVTTRLEHDATAALSATTGTFSGAVSGTTGTFTQLNSDNIRIDGNTILSTDTNGDITLDPNGTGDTVVASGKLGIGDSPGEAKLHVKTSAVNSSIDNVADELVLENNGASGMTILSANNDSGFILFGDDSDNAAAGIRYEHANNAFSFRTNSSWDRMRLTSGGDLLVGTTSAGYRLVAEDTLDVVSIRMTSSSASQQQAIQFKKNGSEVGYINCTTSSTIYGTSSDYRLKENVVDMSGAIDRVKALAPKRFNFIVDPDTTVDGFLAHEAMTVVPEAISGTHNEVDDDGNAVMQGIDQSKLVPLLTAALKESIAKIEALEARVTALEGN